MDNLIAKAIAEVDAAINHVAKAAAENGNIPVVGLVLAKSLTRELAKVAQKDMKQKARLDLITFACENLYPEARRLAIEYAEQRIAALPIEEENDPNK